VFSCTALDPNAADGGRYGICVSTYGVTGGLRRPRVDDDFPVLTDGVIVLRCLSREDAEQHLAGEDDDQIRWLSGGPGSMERLPYWIDSNREQWRTGGPRRHFGVRDAHTDALVGNVEANLRLEDLEPGEVNISYAVFPTWRGRGIAHRAVLLVCDWLRTDSFYVTAVVRAAPDNVHSHKVPKRAGFVEIGAVESPDGNLLVRYEKALREP
jgi:RimJ/RimL family protein N-acetyltransferase